MRAFLYRSTFSGLTLVPVVGDAGGAGSEDCLKVNVYTPVGATKGSNCGSMRIGLSSFRP